MRSSHLVCSVLLVAACSSAPVPAPDAQPFPAPVAETAGPLVPVAEDLAYLRTETIEHSWLDDDSGHMQVAFELSCGTPAGQEEDLQVMLKLNWDDACEVARTVCESSDLTTERGLAMCDVALCSRLTNALFGSSDVPTGSRVERVIWKRVFWR